VCAAMINNSVVYEQNDSLAAVQPGSSDLSKMESEVKQQLVEAAKRHALAKKHRMEALRLSATAEEDKQQALLLKRRAELSKREAELHRSENAVSSAQHKVKALKNHAAELEATADKDLSRADQDKEQIMELEDRAGTLNEKASEEADRIKSVESAERKAAADLPTMLSNAKTDESQAQKLKESARRHMADSERKAAAAKRLDSLAEEKEREAQIVRNQLMAILQEKTNTLNAKEHDAANEEALAKKDAQKAAEEARTFASEAAEKAQLAEEATDNAAQMTPEERGAEAEARITSGEQTAMKQAVHTIARAKKEQEQLHERVPSHREVSSRREQNLQRAGEEAARRRAEREEWEQKQPSLHAREQQLAQGSEEHASVQGLRGDEVGEDENGHLVVNEDRRDALEHGRKHLAEDGHYSSREEAFKQALAAAYRSGYTHEGGSAELQQRAVKPARFEMLGDGEPRTEMLSKGPGETVALEKEPAGAVEEKAPLFSQLWYDPGSLGSLTHSLAHTTARMSKLAPRRDESNGLPRMQDLYEDGHESRQEQKFNAQMSKYRVALKQQRAADLQRASRATEELRKLPDGRGPGLHRQEYAAETTMLTEPQNQWNADGSHAYSDTQRAALRHVPRVKVRENEDGNLVIDNGHEQSLDEFDSDSDERRPASGELQHVERELSESERRDDRLQRRVDRLQSEVDSLSSRRGRMEDLEEVHRHSRRFRDEGRRSLARDEAERRVRQRFHERGGERDERDERDERGAREERGRDAGRQGHAKKAAVSKKFSPDATYEKEYAWDPGHVSVGEIKFQHALKDFDRTKSILREGAMQDDQHMRLPELVPAHLPGQGL